jgi:hypothetical protein
MPLETKSPAAEPTPDWEAEIAALLDELGQVQDELLAVLREKRTRLATADLTGLADSQRRETELTARLKACQQRRSELLDSARRQGIAADNLGRLAAVAKLGISDKMGCRVKVASANLRLLRHESLTNWVLAQRALLHVSQLVEIIATGGRLQPTYGDGDSVHARGALVNHEA